MCNFCLLLLVVVTMILGTFFRANILNVFIINIIFLVAEHEWLDLVLLTLRTIRSNCEIIANWEVEVDYRQNNAV